MKKKELYGKLIMAKQKQEPLYYIKGGVYWALNREGRKALKKKKVPFIDYKTKKMYGGFSLVNQKKEGEK